MGGRTRRAVAGATGFLGLALVGAALAWACSPQASISLNSGLGRGGDPITVHGSGFSTGAAEVRWNSASGPLLATASGRSFSVEITIPSDAPGPHYIVAVGNDAKGVQAGRTQAVFEVAEQAPAGPPAAPGGEGQPVAPQPGRVGGGRPVAPQDRQPAPRGQSPGGGDPGVRKPSRTVGREPSRTGRATPGQGAEDGGSGSPRAAVFPPSRPQSGRREGGTVSEAGLGPVGADGVGGQAGAPRGGSRAEPGPSERTAASDLVEGFASLANPQLAPSLSGGTLSGAEHGSQFNVGMALLGLGLVAMAGCAVAAARRPRRA